MGKKFHIKNSSKTETRCKRTISQSLEKKRQTILRKLHLVTEAYDNDSNCIVPDMKNNMQMHSFFEPDIEKHIPNTAPTDYKCYRCRHFLEIPQNLSQPFCKRIPSFMGQCKAELSFIQAIIWLKSAIINVSRLPVKQLQQIFENQWNTCTNGDPYIKRLQCTKKNVSMSKEVDTSETQNMYYASHINSQNVQNECLNFIPSYEIIESSTNESLTQERYVNYIVQNTEQNVSLKSCIIPETDIESSMNSDEAFDSSTDMFDSLSEFKNKSSNSEDNAKYLSQFTSRNYILQVDETIPSSTIVTQTESELSPMSHYDNYYYKTVLPIQERHAILHKRESILFAKRRVIEGNYSPKSLNNVTLCTEKDNNSQIHWSSAISSSTFNNNSFEIQIDDNSPDIQMSNNIVTGNIEEYSAYTIPRTDVATDNNDTLNNNTQRRYDLRSCKNKIEAHEKITPSPSIIQQSKKFHKGQSSIDKYKFVQTNNLIEEKKQNKQETISANWLRFTLDSLNIDHVILESLKVIFLTLGDHGIAEEYMIRRYWKGTLEEEAINAVLNISDIFRADKKPNICKKEIITTIITTLNKITTCLELNKTSVWIYHIQIVLELCNSMTICVEIINDLIVKLNSFQSILMNGMEFQHNTLNQLQLIFYALNVTLRKYRTFKRSDPDRRPAIPRVTDLWKTRYIDEEFEDSNINLEVVEERWSNVLENFTVVSIEHFAQFAEKSVSLTRILMLQ